MAIATPPTAVLGLLLREDNLRDVLSGAPGDHADFHYLGLRHNYDHDRHPQTNERVVCPTN